MALPSGRGFSDSSSSTQAIIPYTRPYRDENVYLMDSEPEDDVAAHADNVYLDSEPVVDDGATHADSEPVVDDGSGMRDDDDADFDAIATMDVELQRKAVTTSTVDFMVKKMKEQAPDTGVVNPPSRPGEGKVKKVEIRAGRVVQRARIASALKGFGITVRQ